ncbi:Uncharacterised protein [Serratia fonticola]|uniref:Uncharacterized protein n=1 Tax=Serratia fonticola TaxID=47917 RepID=A0A4U9WHY5_SERFO|nr:Uncharacterised protein [Serratia fonticola]
MDQVVNTYRLCAGIMIRMWAIRLETHGFSAGKAMPLTVNRQFKLATDDNDMFNHARLMSRGFTERARGLNR